jgi:hypothetical protein
MHVLLLCIAASLALQTKSTAVDEQQCWHGMLCFWAMLFLLGTGGAQCGPRASCTIAVWLGGFDRVQVRPGAAACGGVGGAKPWQRQKRHLPYMTHCC